MIKIDDVIITPTKNRWYLYHVYIPVLNCAQVRLLGHRSIMALLITSQATVQVPGQ